MTCFALASREHFFLIWTSNFTVIERWTLNLLTIVESIDNVRCVAQAIIRFGWFQCSLSDFTAYFELASLYFFHRQSETWTSLMFTHTWNKMKRTAIASAPSIYWFNFIVSFNFHVCFSRVCEDICGVRVCWISLERKPFFVNFQCDGRFYCLLFSNRPSE